VQGPDVAGAAQGAAEHAALELHLEAVGGRDAADRGLGPAGAFRQARAVPAEAFHQLARIADDRGGAFLVEPALAADRDIGAQDEAVPVRRHFVERQISPATTLRQSCLDSATECTSAAWSVWSEPSPTQSPPAAKITVSTSPEVSGPTKSILASVVMSPRSTR
jgi:hypothetical protein